MTEPHSPVEAVASARLKLNLCSDAGPVADECRLPKALTMPSYSGFAEASLRSAWQPADRGNCRSVPHFSVFSGVSRERSDHARRFIVNVAYAAITVPRSADGSSTSSTSSMCHTPQARHSKVHSMGSLPYRGVLRTSRIGRAQPKQSGERGGLSSDPLAHLSHMTCFPIQQQVSVNAGRPLISVVRINATWPEA